MVHRFKMTLLGIVIVGKKNEPLYLCDCTKLWFDEHEDLVDDASKPDPKATSDDKTVATPNDPFGFLQSSSTTSQGQSLEMEQEFIVHAALDRLEEQVGASKPDGTMPLRKASRNIPNAPPPTPSKKSSSGGGLPSGQYLGLLTVQDEVSAVYGYVTATNIKFLALLKHPSASATTSKTRDLLQEQSKAVRTLFVTLHAHYISYIMNPFRSLDESRIESDSLDRNIRQVVKAFRDAPVVKKKQPLEPVATTNSDDKIEII